MKTSKFLKLLLNLLLIAVLFASLISLTSQVAVADPPLEPNCSEICDYGDIEAVQDGVLEFDKSKTHFVETPEGLGKSHLEVWAKTIKQAVIEQIDSSGTEETVKNKIESITSVKWDNFEIKSSNPKDIVNSRDKSIIWSDDLGTRTIEISYQNVSETVKVEIPVEISKVSDNPVNKKPDSPPNINGNLVLTGLTILILLVILGVIFFFIILLKRKKQEEDIKNS